MPPKKFYWLTQYDFTPNINSFKLYTTWMLPDCSCNNWLKMVSILGSQNLGSFANIYKKDTEHVSEYKSRLNELSGPLCKCGSCDLCKSNNISTVFCHNPLVLYACMILFPWRCICMRRIVYICICVYKYVYMCTKVYLCIPTYAYIYIYMCVCVCVCTFVYVGTFMFSFPFASVNIHPVIPILTCRLISLA